MSAPTHIHLAVEDDLSEAVLRRVLRERPRPYDVGVVFKGGGFGFLKKRCESFNNMSKAGPVLLLTDLDTHACAPKLIGEWLVTPRNSAFIFRVAVREVEAWLLADHATFGKFLAVRSQWHFPAPEDLKDPKNELLRLAEKSAKRIIREGIARRDENGHLRQGPAYNLTLVEYVNSTWPLSKAAKKCPSLERLLKSLAALET